MKRGRLPALALGLIIASGCAEPKPDRVETLIELGCGTLKVRFQERTKTISTLNGVFAFTELLQIDSGGGFRLVDSAGQSGSSGHRAGPEGFSRLLPPDLAFRPFPFDDDKRPDTPSESSWGVFVDPKVATREEYEVVSDCLAKNLTRIDAAFDAPRGTGGPPRDPDQKRRLSSIVYAAFDDEMNMCGVATVGLRWICPGGGYVKTRLDAPHLILCADQQPRNSPMVTRFPVGMFVGAISPDQKQVKLQEPDPNTHDYKVLLAGKEPRAYYASCRDRAGRSLLEVFPPS